MQTSTYAERLRAPLSYWLIALFFGLSVVIALGFYLGPWVALATAVVTVALIAGALLWYGSARVEVGEHELRAGGASVGYRHVGAAIAHDAERTRLRLGRDADAAAYLVERPYVHGSVEIPILDADDPHPYWLLSSRNPEPLADAINAARAASLGEAVTTRQDELEATKE